MSDDGVATRPAAALDTIAPERRGFGRRHSIGPGVSQLRSSSTTAHRPERRLQRRRSSLDLLRERRALAKDDLPPPPSPPAEHYRRVRLHERAQRRRPTLIRRLSSSLTDALPMPMGGRRRSTYDPATSDGDMELCTATLFRMVRMGRDADWNKIRERLGKLQLMLGVSDADLRGDAVDNLDPRRSPPDNGGAAAATAIDAGDEAVEVQAGGLQEVQEMGSPAGTEEGQDEDDDNDDDAFETESEDALDDNDYDSVVTFSSFLDENDADYYDDGASLSSTEEDLERRFRLAAWTELNYASPHSGITVLHMMVCWNCPRDVLRTLIQLEPSLPWRTNHNGITALHNACSFGAPADLIECYIQAVADTASIDDTPHYCGDDDDGSNGPIEALNRARLAARYRCTLHQIRGPGMSRGWTPLHCAAAADAPLSVLRAMLKANADALLVRDARGQTPLDLLCRNYHRIVDEFLMCDLVVETVVRDAGGRGGNEREAGQNGSRTATRRRSFAPAVPTARSSSSSSLTSRFFDGTNQNNGGGGRGSTPRLFSPRNLDAANASFSSFWRKATLFVRSTPLNPAPSDATVGPKHKEAIRRRSYPCHYRMEVPHVLHAACSLPAGATCPVPLMRLLLKARDDQILSPDKYGNYPIHIAANSAAPCTRDNVVLGSRFTPLPHPTSAYPTRYEHIPVPDASSTTAFDLILDATVRAARRQSGRARGKSGDFVKICGEGSTIARKDGGVVVLAPPGVGSPPQREAEAEAEAEAEPSAGEEGGEKRDGAEEGTTREDDGDNAPVVTIDDLCGSNWYGHTPLGVACGVEREFYGPPFSHPSSALLGQEGVESKAGEASGDLWDLFRAHPPSIHNVVAIHVSGGAFEQSLYPNILARAANDGGLYEAARRRRKKRVRRERRKTALRGRMPSLCGSRREDRAVALKEEDDENVDERVPGGVAVPPLGIVYDVIRSRPELILGGKI